MAFIPNSQLDQLLKSINTLNELVESLNKDLKSTRVELSNSKGININLMSLVTGMLGNPNREVIDISNLMQSAVLNDLNLIINKFPTKDIIYFKEQIKAITTDIAINNSFKMKRCEEE